MTKKWLLDITMYNNIDWNYMKYSSGVNEC